MNLRKTILAEHSKINCNKIVKWIGASQQRFDELFNLFLNDEYRVAQRAAWPLSNSVIAHPQLIKKHCAELIKNLHKQHHHDAVKRNTLRLLAHITISKRFHGEIMTLCFDYLISTDEPVAVKAFSLTILDHLSKEYPEIRNELRTIIEDNWDHEPAAFKSRAKKILRKHP